MDTVLILLSTYNGEEFLRELLDSLISQKEVEVHVLVRDDGSTDSTRHILEEYASTYTDMFTLSWGTNIGWRRSFFELLSMAWNMPKVYDYYAFCDQDDIWLPDKLFRAVERISTLKPGLRLYCSNLYYYKNGINYGLIQHAAYVPTPENCLMRNYATGCTVVFNRSLLEVVVQREPIQEWPHDFYVYQVSVLLGSVYADTESRILYRQHISNQIGSKRGWLELWKRRLSTLVDSLKQHRRERIAQELEERFADMLPARSMEAVYKVAHYRESLFSRISLAFDHRFSIGIKSNDFWLCLRILCGRL